jgi:hypothetical protein
MFPYDPELLACVQTPPQNIADVIRILLGIEAICSDIDGLKWFNWLYLQVTQAVETRVATGGFTNPAWLAELDVQFASLYFRALASDLSGETAPGCWRALFERRDQAAIARIQFALAGINAHINHDLPQAIVATCDATSTTPQHGGTEYADYTGLNSSLDTIAAWSVSAARESAWRNAELLWQIRALPSVCSAFLDTLDGFTTVVSKTLLVPVP